MPYSISRTDTLLTVTVSGMVSDGEFRQCVDEVRAIAAESPDLNELVDMRDVTSVEVKSATVRAAAASPPLFGPHSRQAAVATTDIGFGMARMYEMSVSTVRSNVRIFRSLDDALHWLAASE